MDGIVHGILQARILEWVASPSPGNLPIPGIESRSPKLQVDSLPAEPPEKPKNKSLRWIVNNTPPYLPLERGEVT